MKIFWSWQSDTQKRTGRFFIQTALREAISELKEQEDIIEPIERDALNAVHLDHDREGISGSPNLAQTILDKIDSSLVFVADVTPVSTIPASVDGDELHPEKRNMNPNVAIELGYALRALSDSNVLMVMNSFYGDRRYLPFDLAHKAGPILFSLPPDADNETCKRVRKELKDKFKIALRPYLIEAIKKPEIQKFIHAPSTLTPVAYFQPEETLAEFGEDYDKVSYSYPDGNGFYLRVMPCSSREAPFMRSELFAVVRESGLFALWDAPSGLFALNRYGAAVVEPVSPKGGDLCASTQVFPSGEIWGVLRWPNWQKPNQIIVPTKKVERVFRVALSKYVQFLDQKLQIGPPYRIAAGAFGLEGFKLSVNGIPEDSFGPCYDNSFEQEGVISRLDEAELDKFLLLVFEELFRCTGFPRPKNLHNFPAQMS
jgi:hypothetical protein